MHKGSARTATDLVGKLIGTKNRRLRHVPAGHGFSDHYDIGNDAGPFAGEEFAGSPKPGSDLVSDKNQVELVGATAQVPQTGRRPRPHAPGPLQDRLDDNPSQVIAVEVQDLVGLAAPRLDFSLVGGEGRRARQEDLLGNRVAEHGMHATDRVAHAHGTESIAVIGPSEGGNACPRQGAAACCGAGNLHLPSQFEAHFHADRPRIGEEDAIQRWRGKVHQCRDGVNCGLVGESPKHDVAELRTLTVEGLVKDWIAVAVNLAPPRGHRVDDLIAVFSIMQPQPDSVSGHHCEHRVRPDGRGVGVPSVASIIFEKLLFKTHSEEC